MDKLEHQSSQSVPDHIPLQAREEKIVTPETANRKMGRERVQFSPAMTEALRLYPDRLRALTKLDEEIKELLSFIDLVPSDASEQRLEYQEELKGLEEQRSAVLEALAINGPEELVVQDAFENMMKQPTKVKPLQESKKQKLVRHEKEELEKISVLKGKIRILDDELKEARTKDLGRAIKIETDRSIKQTELLGLEKEYIKVLESLAEMDPSHKAYAELARSENARMTEDFDKLTAEDIADSISKLGN